MPPPVVCAALLHDVEDTSCPPQRIADQFGQEAADLITAVRSAEVSACPQAGPGTAPACDAAVRGIAVAEAMERTTMLPTCSRVRGTRLTLAASRSRGYAKDSVSSWRPSRTSCDSESGPIAKEVGPTSSTGSAVG